jgi:hypothetical protein
LNDVTSLPAAEVRVEARCAHCLGDHITRRCGHTTSEAKATRAARLAAHPYLAAVGAIRVVAAAQAPYVKLAGGRIKYLVQPERWAADRAASHRLLGVDSAPDGQTVDNAILQSATPRKARVKRHDPARLAAMRESAARARARRQA